MNADVSSDGNVRNSATGTRSLTFTVDSALLKELGERLVGKAHIALAELIKNAYDADALTCEIRIRDNRIEVVDNGHGMSLPEFQKYWMRVGTTHKQGEARSPGFGRPLTGSKGVGRLSVQFLARKVRIETTASGADEKLVVEVDWDSAIEHEFLTQAEAFYAVHRNAGVYADGARHGLRIVLTDLLQDWDEKALAGLAKEIWTLRPPFLGFGGREGQDNASNFDIRLHTHDPDAQQAFDNQVSAAVERWIAKIEGHIERGRRTARQVVTVTFDDGTSVRETFPIENCRLQDATWEIRVYNLSGHLGGNVKVGAAREYFSEFGGVHVYDGPFRLPYYGIQHDWLGIEIDHSHRRVRSKLLPEHYHVERALNDLPTQGRILGVVRVDTAHEMHEAPEASRRKGEYLKMPVTRDRLQVNAPYEQLRDAVRRSVDFYAVCSMRRRLEEAKRRRPKDTPKESLERVERALVTHQAAMPAEVYEELRTEVSSFVDTTRREQEYRDTLAALLGPLASAGMAALALNHETNRELGVLEGIADRVERLRDTRGDATELADGIRGWIKRLRNMRRVFEPLVSAEDRETIRPMRALRVVKTVVSHLQPFLGGVQVDIDIDPDLVLPAATLAEWQGLIQNVSTNALNAMIDSDLRILRFSAGHRRRKGFLRISDTGTGIDLDEAEHFFKPFRRKGTISEERKSMGLGGYGLGLTIVRMIAEGRRCHVAFVPAEQGFSSTFELTWVTNHGR